MLKDASFIAFISPIISTLIIWFIQYKHIQFDKKRDEERKKEQELEKLKIEKKEREKQKQSEIRKQESLLTMRMVKAVGKLSFANSIAIKNGKINGEMEEAIIYFKDINEDMTKFLQERAVDNLERN